MPSNKQATKTKNTQTRTRASEKHASFRSHLVLLPTYSYNLSALPNPLNLSDKSKYHSSMDSKEDLAHSKLVRQISFRVLLPFSPPNFTAVSSLPNFKPMTPLFPLTFSGQCFILDFLVFKSQLYLMDSDLVSSPSLSSSH